MLKDKIDILDDDKKPICLGLLKEVMFMNNTLEKLKKDIKKNGVTTIMCQGKYDIERTNPSLQSYNSLIKNFTSTSKQLFDMLPKDNDGIDDFDDDDLS